MDKHKIKVGLFVLVLLVGTLMTTTITAVAEEEDDDDEDAPYGAFQEIFDRAISFLIYIAGGITTILLIFCVFMWQKEKAENPDSQEAADWKNRAVKVLIGLVIILVATTLVAVVEYIAAPGMEENVIRPTINNIRMAVHSML